MSATDFPMTSPEIKDGGAASIVVSAVEVLALKKLALINGALAQSLSEPTARREQTALLRVLMDVTNRADLANKTLAAILSDKDQIHAE